MGQEGILKKLKPTERNVRASKHFGTNCSLTHRWWKYWDKPRGNQHRSLEDRHCSSSLTRHCILALYLPIRCATSSVCTCHFPSLRRLLTHIRGLKRIEHPRLVKRAHLTRAHHSVNRLNLVYPCQKPRWRGAIPLAIAFTDILFIYHCFSRL